MGTSTDTAIYSTYQEYLRSSHWKEFSKSIKNTFCECEICGSKANLNTHHLTYERLGRENADDVLVLCNNCHLKVHQGTIAISKNDIALPIAAFNNSSHFKPIKNGLYIATFPQRETGTSEIVKRKQRVNINPHGGFVRLHDGVAVELSKLRLTGCEWDVLFWLGSHTKTGSGAILFDNNKRITKESVANILGWGKTAINKAFAKLIQEEIIVLEKSDNNKQPNKYFFNPYVFMRGRYVNRSLLLMFKNSKWAKLGK